MWCIGGFALLCTCLALLSWFGCLLFHAAFSMTKFRTSGLCEMSQPVLQPKHLLSEGVITIIWGDEHGKSNDKTWLFVGKLWFSVFFMRLFVLFPVNMALSKSLGQLVDRRKRTRLGGNLLGLL